MNLITGLNGVGKTNLLDAIYLMGACRSYFSRIDQQSIGFGHPFSVVHGQFSKTGQKQKASVSLFAEKPKKFFAEGKEISRASEFFGRYPSVMISPEDLKLVTGGSEERRNFIDSIIAGVNKSFLEALGKAKKLTERRNAVLAQCLPGTSPDWALVEIIDGELAPLANQITLVRRQFCNDFIPILKEKYAAISQAEEPGLLFQSPIEGRNFLDILVENRKADLAAGRTTVGVHREDFELLLNQASLKKYGSQGQQKTFVLALKLAQFTYQEQQTGFPPILLLDDLFDRLDLNRVEQLVSLVTQAPFGQLFITDPNKTRVEAAFKTLGMETQGTHLKKG